MKQLILLLILSASSNFIFGQSKFNKELNPKEIKSTMLKVANWQLNNPKHSQKDWTNAALHRGLFATWQTTQDQSIYNALMAVANDSNQWQPDKRWYHADDIAVSDMYIDLYRIEKDPKMIQATIDTIEHLLSRPYQTTELKTIRWWWCDALFMAPPMFVKLGLTTGEGKYLVFNDLCFRQCYDLLFDKEERLFARDLRYIIKNDPKDLREANGEKIFWSRGNGWVMGGLTSILSELPTDYPERPFYENLFKTMVGRILELQQEDGLWRASLLDPQSYPGGEVSGSAFYCHAFAWGINNGILDAAVYKEATLKTWFALNKCVDKNGKVGWVQPIGADPRADFSADSWEVYGTGAFLLAASEVIKLGQ